MSAGSDDVSVGLCLWNDCPIQSVLDKEKYLVKKNKTKENTCPCAWVSTLPIHWVALFCVLLSLLHVETEGKYYRIHFDTFKGFIFLGSVDGNLVFHQDGMGLNPDFSNSFLNIC